MTKMTVTQRQELAQAFTEDLVKDVMRGQAPMAVCDIFAAAHKRDGRSHKAVIAAVKALAGREELDFEYSRTGARRYYLQGNAPLSGGRVVPAASAPRVQVQQSTWISALGAAA